MSNVTKAGLVVRTVVAVAGVLGLAGTAVAADAVRLHGSTTVKAALVDPNKAAIERAADVTLTVVGNGSGKGVQDVVAGNADMAMISAPLDEVVKKVNGKTPGAVPEGAVQAVRLGSADVAFVVHPGNTVESLTIAQVKGLLSGKTTNWKDVGGADAPVIVITAAPGDGIRTVAEEQVLGGDAMAANARALNLASQVPTAVAQVPGAIGITSAAAVTPQVRALKTDKPVSAILQAVTKGAPSPVAQRVIDAMKQVGGAGK
ncbi:MAG TPA: substrate-binding domain-containing protein [Tepidisphaeraceae bacterium]|nr:substrate-binding domain-containing protein [Tepidisphaeraceae bacterium]